MQELHFSKAYRVQIYGDGMAYLITRHSDGLAIALPGQSGVDFKTTFDATFEAAGQAQCAPSILLDDLCARYDTLMTSV